MDPEEISVASMFIKVESVENTNFEPENNLSSKFCQACMANNTHDNNLKDMMRAHNYQGISEVYSEMMEYCFSLQMGENCRERSENMYLICESCIKRLREVVEFKKQIEHAQKNIKKRIKKKKTFNSSSRDINVENSEADLSGIDDKDSILYPVESDLNESVIKKLPRKTEGQNKSPKAKRKISKESSTKKSKTLKSLKKINTRTRPLENKTNHTLKRKIESSNDMEDGQKRNVEKDKVRSVLRTTSKYHELPYVLDKFQLECKICNESFATHKSLQIHMPGHFPNFTCEHCGRGFANLGQFKKHRIVHSTERYECPKCPGKLFKSTDSRSTHMRRKHSDNPNINRCPYCNDRFISYDHRRKHLVSVHGKTEEARKYKCKLCDLYFITSGSRSLHVRKSHLNERNCVCQTCGKSFFSNTCLHQHMLKHTGEKNFTCNLCGKSLQRKYNLTKHMKIHTGDKKHVCSICNKAFIEKCSLQRHMAVHEREDVKGES